MLKPEDHQQVADSLLLSRAEAISLAEALDRKGILLTEECRAKVRQEALLEMLRMLENETPEGISRWHTGGTNTMTAAEMFYAMSHWVENTGELMMRPKDAEDQGQ